MSLQQPAGPIVEAEPPANLIEAGVYATSGEGFQHSLVVLAMGRECWIVPSTQGHRLLVEADAIEPAREQLARYDRESGRWPPRPMVDSATHPTDVFTPMLWAAAVLVVFCVQSARPVWTEAGLLDPAAIFQRGEWWRVLTALFLHADAGHVVSNATLGFLVFTAVLKTLGRGTGWLFLGAASLAGNLAIAAAHAAGPYRSLGASTAIFAAVGLLTGRAVRVVARADHPHRWRAMLVAMGSGLVVLALYGAGGVRIDLGAHLTGFLAGLAFGFMAAARGEFSSYSSVVEG
ncbi:MAG: rhomboid family intramembrane serine protease [Opitutaceae bacterium]